MNMRLYEIADQYQFLNRDLYDPETGVVNEDTLEVLNQLNDTMENKAINITKFFKDLEKEHDAIKRERENMAAREKALKNKIDSLKNYLHFNMEKCQIKKISCPQFVISLQNNPVSLEVIDRESIPAEYLITTVTVDTQRVKEHLKNGVAIPGARLIQKTSLRIK